MIREPRSGCTARRAASLLAALLVGACAPRSSPHVAASPRDEARPKPTDAAPEAEPDDVASRGEAAGQRPGSPNGPVVDLPVEGFDPAVLHVPAGTAIKPLVVGAHGAYDRADAFCHVLARAVRDRAFVLCPRGKRTDARIEHESASYFFPTHLWLEAEIAAAIESLRRVYGPRVDVRRAVYAGFSQGAIMGALVVPRNAGGFPRALLVEGSYGLGRWNVEIGARFRRQSGERVAFVCGGWFCAEQARASAFTIEGGGTHAKVVRASGGHTYGGDVARAIEATFPWLVDGDPRFADP